MQTCTYIYMCIYIYICTQTHRYGVTNGSRLYRYSLMDSAHRALIGGVCASAFVVFKAHISYLLFADPELLNLGTKLLACESTPQNPDAIPKVAPIEKRVRIT